MRIIAIDPGYGRTGIAVMERGPERQRVLYSACFTTPTKFPLHQRIGLIGEELERIMAKYSPQILAIETLFFNTNQKTALSVAEARGAVIAHAVRRGLSICEYTPLQVKSAITGYGRGTKKQVIAMVKRLSDMREDGRTDDEYDAIAVGITCLVSQKQNIVYKKTQ